MVIDDLHAVIPAGGAGTRLWPLSRSSHPKFLLDLTGSGRSLLQQTWDRLLAIVPPERIHVVTGAAHAEAVALQLPELTNLLVEPSPRDSMPAIGLAAAVIAKDHPEALIASFAADHVIDDVDVFAEAVRQGCVAARAGKVATIGIAPREPSTAFGYIEAGASLGEPDAMEAREVVRFVEKPDAETAQGYLDAGTFSWNAGMFVTATATLLDHLARLQPGLHAGLATIAEAWGTSEFVATLDATWPSLTKIAIDHAIAEPVSLEGGIAVVPGAFSWDDVGDFAALHELTANDDSAVTLIDADGLVRATDGRHIAVVGIKNAVVVSTPDAVLVTTLDHTQDVKNAVNALKDTGHPELV